MSHSPTNHRGGRAAEHVVTLDHARVGTRVHVVAVRERETAIGQRLADLGLLPGTAVDVLRRAPLGDPTVFEFRGYQLCLRRREASLVEVTADGTAAAALEAEG